MYNEMVRKILVLEDDKDDFRLIERQISKTPARYITRWCKTLGDAASRLGVEQFDVVITDLNLADSTGFDTVSQLRKHCGRSPIIVLTANSDEDVVEKILASGAQDYLIKGDVDDSNFTRVINYSLYRQNAINEARELVKRLEISEHQQREQAQLLIRKNEKLKTLYNTAQEFVDNVSHDLRTPLTVIKDYCTIIRDGMVGSINEEQQAMLDRVAVRADDLNFMVDDLLDASKLESGLQSTWRRPTLAKHLLDRVAANLEQRAQLKNVDLQVDVDDSLPEVYADAEKAGRVLSNLVVNAIKFAGAPGIVKISAKHAPELRQVTISVSDNGAGILPEMLDKIFDRFQQAGDRVKSNSKGHGLGLNIARRLSELNLGELWAESQVNVGSTFHFSLPVNEPNEVFARWLKQRQGQQNVIQSSVITIGDCAKSETEEFDNFMNCILYQDDLLFYMKANQWVLVTSTPKPEMSICMDRIYSEYERANRNRPFGPLPEFNAKKLADWLPTDPFKKIVAEFSSVLECTTGHKEPIAFAPLSSGPTAVPVD